MDKDGKNLPPEVYSDFVRIRVYNCAAIAYSLMDNLLESLPWTEAAIEAATRLSDFSSLADLKANLVEDYVYAGQFAKAEVLAKESLEAVRQSVDKDALIWATGNLGNLYLEWGRPAEAVVYLEEATARLERMGAQRSEPGMYADLALAYIDLSRCDEARAIARRARRWAGSRRAKAYWLDALGQIEMRCENDLASAKSRFEEAIPLFDEAGAKQFAARSRRNLAGILATMGQTGQALELAQKALSDVTKVNLPLEIAKTQALIQSLAR